MIVVENYQLDEVEVAMGRPADEGRTKLHCGENEVRNVGKMEEFRLALEHSKGFELFQTPSLQYVLIDGESVEDLYLHPGEIQKQGNRWGINFRNVQRASLMGQWDQCRMSAR